MNQQQQHKDFVQKYKNVFKTLDILLIVCLVLNLGTTLMTNVMVMKQNPTNVLVEMNPIVAEINSYESHPQSNKWFVAIQMKAAFTILVFGFYVFWRRYAHKERHLTFLITSVGFLCYILSANFFNDAGYTIGKLLYSKI